MSPTESSAELGLRERKRLATRRAIQDAVLRLAIGHGFDKVTVDEISRAAQVSPRTFFNYFPSKETAIIGDMPQLPGPDAIEAFVEAGPNQSILDGIRDLLSDSADDGVGEDREVHQLRRDLLKDNPQLFRLRMAGMKQLEAELTDVIRRRIVHDDPNAADAADALESRAQLITFVAFAGIRHAWWCWAEQGGSGPLSGCVRESFAQLQSLGATGI